MNGPPVRGAWWGNLNRPAVALLAIHLLLVFPFFLPSLREINLWDEAAYISAGRRLVEGQIPTLADSPLAAGLYAISYLVFQGSPFWLILSCWWGRLVAFLLVWVSARRVGLSLERFFPALWLPGMLMVVPLGLEILTFPSDPLFAGLAGLSLAEMIRFTSSPDSRHLTRASAWVGAATLARNDGLVLFVILLVAALLLSPAAGRLRAALRAALPFLAIVGGYVLFSGVARGEFSTGVAERTYENFESGQQVVFTGSGEVNPVFESRAEAQRLFGTAEQNRSSVWNAIRRNPTAYRARLVAVLPSLPDTLLRAYGIRFAPVILLLAARGIFELWRRRELRLLGLLALWPAHLLTGFVITLFRPGHLQFAFPVVFSLAAIGLAAALARLVEGRERWAWTMGLGGLVLYGLAGEKLAIYYGAVVLGAGMWIAVWLMRRLPSQPTSRVAASMVLLGAALVVHGNYPSPRIPRLGVIAEERALEYMTQTLPSQSLVAAGSPGVVWAAGMTYAGLAATDIPLDSTPVEFLNWMRDSGFRAVYVDASLSAENPKVWELISNRIDHGLVRGFLAEEGDIQVLLVEIGSDG
ncbi:MAG: hypothetical protein WD906_07720 [Anaerolineales bacterium]